MLNLLRVKVAPTTTKPSHNQHTVHRWRLRNLHTSPLKPSFIKTDGKFQNKVPLQSFYNNNKLTTAHLFGQSFYRQTYNKTVPEKYKKYSTIFSDSGEDELSAKKDDWGPAYSDPVINEIDKRRKMKWMKFIPKGIPKKHEEMVPPELHRIIPPIPLGGEHRYESKWQWPRKIYDMKQGNELFMERGREFIKWQKKWRDRWRSRPDVYKWLDQNARFPKLFITRRRTFWLVLVFLMFLYYLDYKKQTGFYLAREWEAYIRYVLKNPMLPPAVEVAAERLLNIRKDEQIHRFASKVGETLPILEIHTSRYTEPAHPNDHREDDQIKIHISQPPIPEDDTLDMHTDHLSEYKLWPIPPIRKPKPETRDYPLTKQPKADIQMIPEVPKEHLDQHTVLHPVLSGDITPTFFVGMFDQHNTRHAQDFTSTQLFDYVKWLLSWKQSQQLNNDWIANSVKKDIKFDPTHDDQREVSEEIKEAIRERAEQFKGWSLDRWNKDNPELRQIVKNLTGEKNASEDRVDHIILKLRNIYDLSRAIPASFMKAFKSADHDYMMNAVLDPHKFHEGFSGACAMVTMFFNRWIFVGSVGDFRAFVVKRSFDEHRESYHWSMSSVSFPHTPILDAEIGTRTHQHAVQNGLIVEEKGFGFGPRKLQQFKEAAKTKDPLDTTAEPHLNSYQVQKDDSVVVMVSPGVLNVVKTSEIMDMITKKMDDIDDGVDKEENVASMIVYAAAARSKDLIDPLSASVVFLNPKYHEQVPPMYEIPKLYDVKIPQKNFEFTENWADSRPNILLPLQVAAEVGEWSEKISSETSARLSKRWDMHVQPLLPEGPAVPAFFNSIKTSVSDSWKQFREFVKPAEDQVKQAMDLPQEYVETYFQQKVDDQYYRWLKRSLDGEMWPSKIHVQQFIEAARARGRDLEEADKLEEAMMFQEYIDTKSLRARAFWRRKTPPPYREEVLKFFKDKYDADLSDKSMDELEEEYEKAKKEEKEKQKKLAEDRKKKQKERAEERTKQIAEARKKKLAELEEEEEEKEAKEAVVAKKEAAEKEKKEKVAEKAKPKALPTEQQEEEVSKKEEEVPKTEKVLTKKELEAAEKAKKEAAEKEIKEREKKEREKNTEPTPQQEWNKVQENYTVEMPKLRGLGDFDLERYLDDRRRVYLDPTIIVQKYAGEYKTQPTIDTEHEWRWQDGFKPRFFNVTPEQNMEYQHVIAADVVIAAVGAAATGTPPALEEAGVVYLTQRGLDLGTPALRQVFYEPYSDETLKLVMEIEKDRKDKEQPATLEYQRRNPVFKQKKQQQQQKTQQKKKPSKTQPKEEEEEEE